MNVGHARERVRGGGRIGKTGMTMVELIVVLALIAIMSAVVVPTFARLGYFSRNDAQASARELFSMLKAAKIYALTYRVNTAVAYGLTLKVDSITNQTVETIDAAALVYKLPTAIRSHTYFFNGDTPQPNPISNDDTVGTAYVPVNSDESGTFFRPTKPDTAILVANLLPDGKGNSLGETLSTIRLYNIEEAYDRTGKRIKNAQNEPLFRAESLNPLRIADDDPALRDTVLPSRLKKMFAGMPAGQKYPNYNNTDQGFPAHIFTPSGMMMGGGPERFRLLMGYSPDASPTERYTDPEAPTDAGLRTEAIELSHSTGRVQLVQE